MNKALLDQILLLPADERVELAEALWDSLNEDELPPLTKEQIEECERRLAEHERNPGRAVPWEEVRERLWSRYK